MITLEIGKQIEAEVVLPVEQFQLVVHFMHGDADHFTEEHFLFGKDQLRELKQALQFFKDCIDAYPHGSGGSDHYNDIDNYASWSEFLHSDIFSDGEFEATVEYVELTYWNTLSQQYEVTINY